MRRGSNLIFSKALFTIMSQPRKIIILAVLGLFALSAGFAGRWVYEEYRQAAEPPADYIDIEAEEQKRAEAERQYIAAMTADIYGGQTPEETLQLFIEALKADDIELAAKYFALETNTQDPNYLTRKGWIDRLTEIKNRNLLSEMISDLGRAQPDLESRVGDNDYKFLIFTEDGEFGAFIDMKFNTYSQVWKIESL